MSTLGSTHAIWVRQAREMLAAEAAGTLDEHMGVAGATGDVLYPTIAGYAMGTIRHLLEVISELTREQP